MTLFSDIVKRLGVLRDQLLVFTIILTIIIHYYGARLSADAAAWKAACGIVMHFFGIVSPVGFGIFYCYAFVYLPSTDHELQFSKTAQKTLAAHAKRTRRADPSDT